MASDEKTLLTSKREDDGRKLITEPKQPKKGDDRQLLGD